MLVALDAKTGKVVWTAKVDDYKKAYYMSLAPLIADGKVILGASGGELGVRGFVAALDAETELTVMDNLRKRGCACVVSAHRLSTVRDSDEIVVLQHGTIVERGRHEELVARGGAYAALVKER